MPRLGASARTLVVSTSVMVILGVALVWGERNVRPRNIDSNLDRVAATSLDAMCRADGESLVRVAYEEEIESNDLTAEKLNRLYKELVIPRLKASKRSALPKMTSHDTQSVAAYSYEGALIKNLPFAAEAYALDRGIRVSVLAPLTHAWCVEYFSKNKASYTSEARDIAILEGLRSDRQKLIDMGISSLPKTTGELRMASIDDLIQDYESRVP